MVNNATLRIRIAEVSLYRMHTGLSLQERGMTHLCSGSQVFEL